MTMVHDLLTEPLLSWRDTQRRRGMTTLPGILAKLAAGELGDYPRVRTHQFHPWSMFLPQLAAIALHRAGKKDPRVSESDWRAMLLSLTDNAHEPWCLLVDDLSKAAFFQPPVPEATKNWALEENWDFVDRPDEIDILVTSKAHDVKESRLDCSVPEFWVYALVTLETMQGYPGRGYNPISRMKGGYGNRPRVGLAADTSLAARFLRDVDVLLDCWASLLKRGFSDKGVSLVWTLPWDGNKSLDAHDLSPHFIEICWRIRCFSANGIHCAYTTTTNRRCLATIENGDVGDPWIPVKRAGGALTVGSSGFNYELLTHLLLGDDYEQAAAQVIRPGDSDPVLFLAAALVRGQGKTEGLHERTLVLAGEVKRRLGQPDQRAALGRRAAAHVEQAKKMRSKVLFPALMALALGEKPVEDNFYSRIDEVFFSELFRTLDREEQNAQLEWELRLTEIAESEIKCVIERCTLADAQRYRAIAKAEALFRGCLGKVFPDVKVQRMQNTRQDQKGGGS